MTLSKQTTWGGKFAGRTPQDATSDDDSAPQRPERRIAATMPPTPQERTTRRP